MKPAGFVYRKLIWIILASFVFMSVYIISAALETWSLIPKIPRLSSNDIIQKKLKLDSWLPLSEISDLAMGAIIVSEDDNFFHHQGYEMKSIKEAIKTDLSHFEYKRGASTITQQVIKNVFLNREKSLRRKIEELILAHQAEETFGKDRILEIYLNTAQFGAKLYGIEKASIYYFEKPASELTAREGAFLAMLLPSPVRYGKSFSDKKLTPYAEKTISSILKRMAAEEYISAKELGDELQAQLPFEKNESVYAVTPTTTP